MKQIEDKLLERFKKLVTDHIGLRIGKEDSETFRKALTIQMKSLNIVDPERYLSFLESDTGASKQEWKAFIISITTGESYFFRDKGHFFLLQNTILPELIKKKETQRSLRIWSAGCTTGEEPYSIAILLDMLLPDLKGWDIFIIGTDINEESLKNAARGIYSQWSFRMLGKDIQSRYFKSHQDKWEIHENIKKMVNFQYGNLIEDGFFSQNPEICNMDIIICRNVFIYFEKEAVSSVLNKFQRILNQGGYLVTGHAELYGHDLTNLSRVMFPEAVIYKKTAELKVQTTEITRLPECIKEGRDLRIKELPVPKSVLPFPELSKINTLNPNREPEREIEELIKKGRYTEAIDKAESFLITYKDNYDLFCLLAQAYANSGDYEKAASACRRAMNINAHSADPYLFLAHVAEARGNDAEAKDLFKKAIYLDPAFIAAYCELGGLYEKENDIPRARKARTTAIEFLKYLPSEATVKPYDITAGELLKYVEYLAGSKDAGLMPAGPGEQRRL
jgi:chemotaxis protein methyltransferase CheR